MKKKIAVVIALLALAGFAAANALTVKQRQDTASLHAERYTVGQLFVIESSLLAPVSSAAPAAGTIDVPVEMGPAMPAARTALTQDHWAYSVTVKEATPGGVPSGAFAVELQKDGSTVGTAYVEQGFSDAAQVEGARVSFALGSTVGPSSLYYVLVKPYVPAGSLVSYSVRTAPDASNSAISRWFGVGGSINGLMNPELGLELGKTIRVTAVNDDGQTHNLGFKDSAGQVVAGYTDNFGTDGQEVVLSWAPAAAGTYTYVCAFHASMTGNIVVA